MCTDDLPLRYQGNEHQHPARLLGSHHRPAAPISRHYHSTPRRRYSVEAIVVAVQRRDRLRGVAGVRCRAGGRLLSRSREHDALSSDCRSGLSPGRIARRRRRLLTAGSCWPEQAPPRSRFACAPSRSSTASASTPNSASACRSTVSTPAWRGCASSRGCRATPPVVRGSCDAVGSVLAVRAPGACFRPRRR